MQSTLFLVIYSVCLLIYLVFSKQKKPYVILGILFAITFSLKDSWVSIYEKCGMALVFSAAMGIYDLSFLQKVKGAWRYHLAPFVLGFYFLIMGKLFR